MNTTSNSIASRKYLTLFSLLFLFIACNSSSNKKNQLNSISKLEKFLFDDDGNINPSQQRKLEMEQLREAYKNFTHEFSSDTSSARFLYNWAMLEADFFKRFDESAYLLERFSREFPLHELAPKALFLEGFTYAEYVQDYKKAELAYQSFLQKFPNHEMVPSIKFELQNLGKSPEELLNMKLNTDSSDK